MMHFIQPRGQWYAKNTETGEHIAVGHHEYLSTPNDKCFYYSEDGYDQSDKQQREWAGLIVSKARLIIRPRANRDMTSYSGNHWGTLFDVKTTAFSADGMLLCLENPIKIEKSNQDLDSEDKHFKDFFKAQKAKIGVCKALRHCALISNKTTLKDIRDFFTEEGILVNVDYDSSTFDCQVGDFLKTGRINTSAH